MSGGALPNLIIIGAMKCGTSSLHYYLGLHPDVAMSRPKELNFFIESQNWGRGVGWYRSRFDARARIRGEASPGYTAHPQHPGVAERMHGLVPDARLIYMVRDPLERLLSHYRHNVTERLETRPLDEAVLEPDSRYVARSRYATQLDRYLALWPRERVLVLEQAALRDDRAATLRRVFEFLGIEPSFNDPRFGWERHRSDRKRRRTDLGVALAEAPPLRWLRRLPAHVRWPVEDAVLYPFSRPVPPPRLGGAARARVTEVLADEAARLRALTGEPFASWSV